MSAVPGILGRVKRLLRRFADGLPFFVVCWALFNYRVEERLLGYGHGGLGGLGITILSGFILTRVLRLLSGMTLSDALWPDRESSPTTSRPVGWEHRPPSMDLVEELAQSGMKIQAVKMHRELTGANLKDCVDAVNAMVIPKVSESRS